MYMCIWWDGASPLYAACEEGHADVVDILINAFPNIHKIATKVQLEWQQSEKD